VLAEDVLRVEHCRTGAPVVAYTERDMAVIDHLLDLAQLFEVRRKGLFDVHGLAGFRRQGDHRETKLLSRREANYVNFGIFDGALEVLADMFRAKDIKALGQDTVIQVNAGVKRHSGRFRDIGDVLGTGDRTAANHSKAKRLGSTDSAHIDSFGTSGDIS
jgi:hypothetical protein